MSKKCDICGNKIGMLNTFKASNGLICANCNRICQSYQSETIENLKKYWEINSNRLALFNKTSELKNFMSELITIDSNNKLFIIGKNNKLPSIVYSFDEVESYKFEIIGSKTITKKKGGIGKALIGGAIAGPVGAIVGSSLSKEETKTVGGTSFLYIHFLMPSGNYTTSIQLPPSGFTDFLDKCILNKNKNTISSKTDVVSDIKKFKELLDIGAITQDEFEKKKSELLNM